MTTVVEANCRYDTATRASSCGGVCGGDGITRMPSSGNSSGRSGRLLCCSGGGGRIRGDGVGSSNPCSSATCGSGMPRPAGGPHTVRCVPGRAASSCIALLFLILSALSYVHTSASHPFGVDDLHPVRNCTHPAFTSINCTRNASHESGSLLSFLAHSTKLPFTPVVESCWGPAYGCRSRVVHLHLPGLTSQSSGWIPVPLLDPDPGPNPAVFDFWRLDPVNPVNTVWLMKVFHCPREMAV